MNNICVYGLTKSFSHCMCGKTCYVACNFHFNYSLISGSPLIPKTEGWLKLKTFGHFFRLKVGRFSFYDLKVYSQFCYVIFYSNI